MRTRSWSRCCARTERKSPPHWPLWPSCTCPASPPTGEPSSTGPAPVPSTCRPTPSSTSTSGRRAPSPAPGTSGWPASARPGTPCWARPWNSRRETGWCSPADCRLSRTPGWPTTPSKARYWCRARPCWSWPSGQPTRSAATRSRN